MINARSVSPLAPSSTTIASRPSAASPSSRTTLKGEVSPPEAPLGRSRPLKRAAARTRACARCERDRVGGGLSVFPLILVYLPGQGVFRLPSASDSVVPKNLISLSALADQINVLAWVLELYLPARDAAVSKVLSKSPCCRQYRRICWPSYPCLMPQLTV